MIIKSQKEYFLDYLTDSSNLNGDAFELIFPEQQDDVVDAILHAVQEGLPLTVSAARTGNVGGAVPNGGALLSTERLNKIIRIDPSTKSAAVEAGVSFQELEQHINRHGLSLMSYPTEKLASSGGAVNTNCSGLRSYKYGSLRNFVKRIKVALSTGDILDIERGKYFAHKRNFDVVVGNKNVQCLLPDYQMPRVKHQAGYFVRDDVDLIDIFIGSEGTLGVVFYVEFFLTPLPESFFDILVFFSSEEEAFAFCHNLKAFKMQEPGALTSIEFFDRYALQLLEVEYAGVIKKPGAAVYFEYEIPRRDDEEAILMNWEQFFKAQRIDFDECYVGIGTKEKYFLYSFRHKVPEAINTILRQRGQRKLSTDCAVPQESFEEMYKVYKTIGGESNIEYVLFGHIGENHLHFNFLPKDEEEFTRAKGLIKEIIKEAIRLGGTFSAEHGVGKTRKEYLPLLYSPEHIQQMKALKLYLDPHNILGRGNIFD